MPICSVVKNCYWCDLKHRYQSVNIAQKSCCHTSEFMLTLSEYNDLTAVGQGTKTFFDHPVYNHPCCMF